MKRSILFVIDSLECAGAEKSLVTLLNLLDYTKYSVDLMLFAHGKELEELVPEEVNILPPLKYTYFTNLNIKDALTFTIKNSEYKFLYSRLKYSASLRKSRSSNLKTAMLFWKSVSSVIEKNRKPYDIAISYAQGIPTFYVAEKVNAAKKFAWVNASLVLDDYEKKFHQKFYEKYNNIIAVSDSVKNIFSETFPAFTEKIEVIYDIYDGNLINKMAEMNNGYSDNFNGLRILTIGRLAELKGYDFALEACKLLKEKGIIFKWYVLGRGPLQNDIEKYINNNDLKEQFILMGVKTNPYPYIKKSDIYVQTSKSEGFGLAIAEARMLNVPVVTTRFDAVYNQMIDEKNGLIVDMDAEAVYQGIMRLINEEDLRERIHTYLKNEKKGNLEEINKINKLIV